jgi:galactoside O-acetyltransferase
MQNPFEIGYYTSEELRTMGFAKVGDNVSIARNCSIYGLGNISLGNNVRIDGFCTLTAAGNRVTIGSYVHIGTSCLLLGGGGITLEDFSSISHGVKIFTGNDDFSGGHLTNPTVPAQFLKIHCAPVTLKKHAIVGAGSIILPGVTLEEGVAVGALSLVKRNLPAWTIYAGYPARKIGVRSQELLVLEQSLLEALKPRAIT